MSTLRTAVVTGGGSGVGAAIALALAAEGCNLHLIGRRLPLLETVAAEARTLGVTATCHSADLADDVALAALCDALRSGPVDVLVHSAALIELGTVAAGRLAVLDAQHRANLRAPYALTQALLPALKAARGEVVFINSSSGINAKAGTAGYDASKHALRALADSLRQEVNADGVRVLSLYLGQTASAMQEKLSAELGRSYAPERLIQPADAAAAVVAMLRLARTAEVTDLHMRPMQKS